MRRMEMKKDGKPLLLLTLSLPLNQKKKETMSSRLKFPILEKCGKCLKDLSNPKTLPCLHSLCSNCIDDVIKGQIPAPVVAKETRGSNQKRKRQKLEPTPTIATSTVAPSNLKCPQCHGDFEILNGGFLVDPFVQRLAKQKMPSVEIDPNDVKCSCDDDAENHCEICDQFFCARCTKSHDRNKTNAHHVTVSLDIHFSGKKSAKGKTIHHCLTHPGFVIDVFCKTCSLLLCAHCVITDHKTHDYGKLTEMNQAFSDEIMNGLKPVQEREKELREAILLSSKTMKELNQNAQSCIKDIKETFGIIQESLEKRKNELLNETEAVRYIKEKKLMIQREDMEFFAEGMRSSGEFAKGLVKKGSQMEVAMSKKVVMSRLTTLEDVSIEMCLHEDSLLKFGGGAKDEVIKVINEFGSVLGNQTSAKTSKIEWEDGPDPSISLNEKFSFEIISMNKEGERINRGGDCYSVDIADNSNIQAKIVDYNDGSYSVSFVANVKGTHRVSVSFGGEDIQGSPFDLRVGFISAKTSYLMGNPFGTVNQTQKFTIVSCDEAGNKTKQGGVNFACSVTVNNQPQAPPVITDLKNGTYQFNFTPATLVKCSISVKLDGQEIKGSPVALFDFATYFFGRPKQFQPLYDALVDGYSNKTFHDKCDNINGTVTLVTLQNGAIFGGYNDGCWTNEEKRVLKTVPNCFVFSVTDGKGSGSQKFPSIPGKFSIWCSSADGPMFGGNDLSINLNGDPRGSSQPLSYYLPSGTTLAGSSGLWSFANVQVFRVI